VLQFAALSFDVTVEEIFPVLLAGGRVVLRDAAELATAHGLVRAIEEEGVTTVELPTAFWHDWVFELQRSGERLPACLRRVLTGTEQILAERLAAWLDLGVPLVHVFGLTEVTVTSMLHVLAPGADFAAAVSSGLLPIGRPFGGTRAYVLDAVMREVPAGVAGELFLGGSGVARGYLRRPEQTAERFVPNPFATAGERLYRTGDLARWLADGNLVFLGRRDRQVKVRGFRIELGEIEAALAALPGIREAVVVTRRYAGGDQRLVAYVVGEGGEALASQTLKAQLAAALPSYMVPSYFVVLAALPLTANGKLDRRALPAPVDEGLGSGIGFVALQTPTEEILAAIWSDLLEVDRIGRDDDFFARGGHSLLATQLVSRVRAAFGVELPLRALFEQPTVGGMARLVDELVRSGQGAGAPPLVRRDREAELPLSHAQQRLWFLHQMDSESSAYNVPLPLRLRGALDVAVLAGALSHIVARHEVLRTHFIAVLGRPLQVIDPPQPFLPAVIDLTALSPAGRDGEARRLAAAESRRPFDLEHGPLLRAALLRMDPEDWVALFTMHHIVSDGWSTGILVRELSTAYDALGRGDAPRLPELPVQYADYAAWQNGRLSGELLESELAHWRGQLAGAPATLDLPFDRPRPPVQPRIRGAAQRFTVSAELSDALRAMSRDHAATLFMTLLTGLQVLLGRLAGQDDVVIGTPIAGRSRLEVENLIGFFVNTLVLRLDLSGNLSFAGLLARARTQTLAAYAHQDLPFEKLVEELVPERSLGHAPLFQVLFGFQNEAGATLELSGLTWTPFDSAGETAKFDLTLSLEVSGRDLNGTLEYNRDLFDRMTIEHVVERYERLLAAAVKDVELPVFELPLLAPAEAHQLLVEWNATASAFPRQSIPSLFALQAARGPRQTAWVLGQEELSYEDLDRRSNRVAWHLRRQGVTAGDLVGLCVERSGAMLVAMLGILKAGAAYLPLDPGYPRERLGMMLEDSHAPLLLTQEGLAARLPATAARVVLLDAGWEEIAQESDAAIDSPATAEDLAYVIYTSGSTGRPKGVA
ncbi:MAG TPA: condensation domain-containing protein, partial [Thermoanaerobaculia bacterium]